MHATILDSLTTETILADMREWLCECFEEIGAAEEIASASWGEIYFTVARMWDGGIPGFCRTMYGDRYQSIARDILRDHFGR